MDVLQFIGTYRFLSNFDTTPFTYNGIVVKSAEHAFQMEKSLNPVSRLIVLNCATPKEAKQAGRKIGLRSDWEDIKIDVMYKVTKAKYKIISLRDALLETKDSFLKEGNWWHDNFWGSCTCERCNDQGRNELGKILMKVRKELEA